jgi:hypothetical protein
MSARDLLREILRQRRHFERDSVRVELLVREGAHSATPFSWVVGVRVRGKRR